MAAILAPKARDLFDLHFLATRYPDRFCLPLVKRLKGFAQDPGKLADLYRADIEEDPLLNEMMDVEQIALELNDMANRIYMSKQTANHSAIQAMTQKNNFQNPPAAATNTDKQEDENRSALSSSFKFRP